MTRPHHFSKTDAMRYTGHLDLHRAWERTFRRAGLPLAYTQGFSPHPRINLACRPAAGLYQPARADRCLAGAGAARQRSDCCS